jgi:hypothetical protein
LTAAAAAEVIADSCCCWKFLLLLLLLLLTTANKSIFWERAIFGHKITSETIHLIELFLSPVLF